MNQLQNELQRGWNLHTQKKYAEAESIYRNVLTQAPHSANAWCYLGITLHDQRRYPEAIQAYDSALTIQPEFPIALNNRGNSLRYTGQYEEADASFQKAIDIKPDYLNAYKNRGTLHVWTGSLDKGLHYYEQALAINPNEAELRRNLGVIYLLQGRFQQGWPEYRWRWQVGDLRRPNINAPIWTGQPLEGKSILLAAEQGLGDTLNFVRFATLLRRQGAQTTVYSQPALVALLQNSSEFGRIYPNSLKPDRNYDFHCSLLDVADILAIDENSIPSTTPYLAAAENLLSYWAQRFPQEPQKFRIGIAWQGNPDHQADAFRSFALRHYEALSALPNVELISLQNGFGTEQLKQWQGARPIVTLDANVDRSSGAFMDTAAIMRQLNLVITSDTAIAHLAGALHVPTWIALGYVPDWRWLLVRADSPWYPSVRLFRQPTIGDWTSVFAAIQEALSQHLAKSIA